MTPAEAPIVENSYRAAEALIGTGDNKQARAALLHLVERYPQDKLVDAALFDLARLALASGEHASARLHLKRLLSEGKNASLKQSARYLDCRIDVAEGSAERAASCLTKLRTDFPQSTRDRQTLALLISLHQDSSRCAIAIRLLDEYLTRYPEGKLAKGAGTRRENCRGR